MFFGWHDPARFPFHRTESGHADIETEIRAYLAADLTIRLFRVPEQKPDPKPCLVKAVNICCRKLNMQRTEGRWQLYRSVGGQDK